MFDSISSAISSLGNMFWKFFELKTVENQNLPTTEIIDDKRDFKKALNAAEKIINLVQKYKSEMTFADRLRFSHLSESFFKHNWEWNMEKFVEYAPILIVLIMFLVQQKVFVTPEELEALKSILIEYISEHYVSDKTYRENHRNLQEQLSLIHQDINDVKNLLIQKKDN